MGLPEIGAENFLDSGTVAAVSEHSGFPKENAFDRRLYTFWQAKNGTTRIVVDMGATPTTDPDYLAFQAHTLTGARVQLIKSSDNFVADVATLVDINAVADNLVHYRSFTPTGVPKKYYAFDVSGHSATFQLGMVSFGRKVQFPFGMEFMGFDPLGERTIGVSQRSQTGQLLGSAIRYVERTIRVTFRLLPTDTFVDDATVGGLKHWWENIAFNLKPFFWNWNPDSVNTHEKETLFGSLPNNADLPRTISAPNSRFKDVTFTVVGIKEI